MYTVPSKPDRPDPAPFIHAPWCDARSLPQHAVCRWPFATITLGDRLAQVALYRARGTAAIITLTVHEGGAQHLTALTPDHADQLGAALAYGVRVLRSSNE